MCKFRRFLTTASGKILLGLVLGIIIGVGLLSLKNTSPRWTECVLQSAGYLHMLGQIFMNLMYMCVPFLIFGSVVMSVSSVHLEEFKRLGIQTLWLFFMATALSATLAILISTLLPFQFDVEVVKAVKASHMASLTIQEIVLGFFPNNVFTAFTQPSILQIIVFSCLFGACINLLRDVTPNVEALLNVTLAFRSVVLKMISLIMKVAPIAVFGIVSSTIVIHGLGTLKTLGMVLVYITALNVLFFLLYTLFICLRYRLSPAILLKKSARVMIFAGSITSTALSLPLAMDSSRNLGVSKKVTNFVLPLGNSLNTNGGPITNVIIVIAVAHCANLEMTLSFYVMLGIYATIASLGNPGVLGGALVSLLMLFDLVGLPKEAALIFFSLDYFYAITRVIVNVMGNIYASIILAHAQGEFDREVFESSKEIACTP
ncbi:dicarboxylate/amino acid:cation symporter [Wohlfahrtiimonas chitiniclastica]|uniref:dicarboxylate/amino acid:cation symporter n=1 Tax=Wohlfahrtiimonas chitiniclastica TaxID=400946 RepID=UPI001BCBC32F|nr:dicarboxylate/amino acid:cation symporter [Wohlfahrtiimonas chitiniclastica]MBS7827878.1 dicarboxylate/amino acid:cation symporter [Wohlfahrtiimonas chitiniclastica]